MTFAPTWPPLPGRRQALALLLSLALHVLALMAVQPYRLERQPPVEDEVLVLEVTPVAMEVARPEPMAKVPGPVAARSPQPAPTPERQPAFMAAPPAPTAQEWALAGQDTRKTSKRYRYTWGQQVRSMMGTAYEGADQGLVRFRVEIAPDGRLARLETLWSTSEAAERLARQAVTQMPPLPPTPTGQPLVFEQTIAFQPYAVDGPPLYRNDCLPDPPAFRNPFAWDGRAAAQRTAHVAAEAPDPRALEECLRNLPPDSVEADRAHDRRKMEQWGWSHPVR